MAKKQTEGTVNVSLGLKFWRGGREGGSTGSYDIGLSSPILSGEDDHDALARVQKRLEGFLNKNVDKTMNLLSGKAEELING